MSRKLEIIPIVVFFVCTLIIAFSQQYVNEDLFLSLAAGREILAHGPIYPDTWSFTQPGEIWINQAWLSHLIFFQSYVWAEAAGLLILKGLLLLTAAGLTLLRGLRNGFTLKSCLIAVGVGMWVTAPFVALRPENFGLVCLCAVMLLLSASTAGTWLRIVGILMVFVIWVNVHGSFILGIALVYLYSIILLLRLIIPGFRQQDTDRDAMRWIFCSLSCSILIVIVSPYGIDNLLMPFIQIGSSGMTAHSADWLSLFNIYAYTPFVFGGGSPYLYILFVLLIVGLICASIVILVKTRKAGLLLVRKYDLLFEILAALLLIILSIRFRRFILFAGLPLSISALIFIDFLRNNSTFIQIRSRMVISGFHLIGILGCIFVVYQTYISILPYYPSNPNTDPKPLARKLISMDNFSSNVPGFLKENFPHAKVLAGWEISSFLVLHVPGIKLFMDPRDQSFYSGKIVSDFFKILNVLPTPIDERLKLLEKHSVEVLVLNADKFDLDTAADLLKTRQWICVYFDLRSFVLIPSKPAASNNEIVSRLEFAQPGARTLAKAVTLNYAQGRVPPHMCTELLSAVKEFPGHDSYALLSSACGVQDCENREGASILEAEARRLEVLSTRDNSSMDILESRVILNQLLATWNARCGNPSAALQFSEKARTVQYRMHELEKRFSGRIWSFE